MFLSKVRRSIYCKIQSGDQSDKPGWIRLSIHPTMSNEDVNYIIDSIKYIIDNISEYRPYYKYDNTINDFIYCGDQKFDEVNVNNWFALETNN